MSEQAMQPSGDPELQEAIDEMVYQSQAEMDAALSGAVQPDLVEYI